MPARAVALVAGKAVGRIADVELGADAVAGHLGHDAGGRNRGADGIAVDDRALREVDLAQAERVDDQVVRLLRHAPQRLGHGQLRRLQDVDAVDHLDLHAADTHRLRPIQDLRVERLPPGAGNDLAVAQALDPMAFRQDHRRRHDRSRQRPPADFVDAGDTLEAGKPQLTFVAHVRVPRTPMLAAHGPAPNDRSHDEIGHRVSGARAGWRTCRRGRAGSRAGRGGRRRDEPPRSSPRAVRAP